MLDGVVIGVTSFIVGAVVSIVKSGIVRGSLSFSASSVTVTVIPSYNPWFSMGNEIVYS